MFHRLNRFVLTNILLLVLSTMTLVNVSTQEFMPGTASYSFNLGVLDCDNLDYLRGCRHEIGHKMDDQLGMPSTSIEFRIATKAYVDYYMQTAQVNDLAIFIAVYPDSDPRELYAAIYAYVNGDISQLPPQIRKYYTDDQSYLDLYSCLSKPGFNVCDGLSFSFLKG